MGDRHWEKAVLRGVCLYYFVSLVVIVVLVKSHHSSNPDSTATLFGVMSASSLFRIAQRSTPRFRRFLLCLFGGLNFLTMLLAALMARSSPMDALIEAALVSGISVLLVGFLEWLFRVKEEQLAQGKVVRWPRLR